MRDSDGSCTGKAARITFRTATPKDVDRLVSLALRAYPLSQRPESALRDAFENNPWSTWDDIWVGEIAGEVVASAFLHPFAFHAWGRTFRAGGLGGVAVAPDHRRGGVARALIRRTQDACAAKGWPLCLLYPFRVDFYRRLGWGSVEFRKVHRVPAAAIPDDPAAGAVRVATLADVDRLLPVYEAFASKRNGFFVRDGASWMRRLLAHPPFVAVYEPDGTPEGYLFYRVECAGGDHFLHQRMRVLELVWTSDEAWRGLWGFVRRQSDQIAEVSYDAREDDGFVQYVATPTLPGLSPVGGAIHKTADEGLGLQAKILDPAAVAGARAYGDGEGSLDVGITDPLTQEVAAFTLRVTRGRGSVQPTTARGDRPWLHLSSGTWAAIQCGALRVSDALRIGQATGELDGPAWDRLFDTGARWGLFEGF